MAETMEKGTITMNTENIFPIIKKFLYSDHEIFLRELVSNAVDATQKLKKLAALGEATGELGDLKIEVSFDKKARTKPMQKISLENSDSDSILLLWWLIK